MRGLLAALWRASIWHPTAVPHDAAYIYVSPIKRVFLPAYDFVILWLGLAGLVQGFQSMSAIMPGVTPKLIYGALALAAAVCFLGCAFPRLWRIEIGGKIAIVSILSMIALSMTIAGLTIPNHTGITITPMVVALLIPPLIRLWTMGRERGRRKAGL
ncbi:hypothetical protein L332_03675 [Agrococcus pavilionensis RW1]|uniref:Uncharacterized protein n=1 Tax=Agrococcus pavilionensis RW1 TaxID=1330458 RepID=U1MNS8_9MICO|nr:hypothetical protein [Agrococcus pavilionensis]ERG63551.1 hypothetical protein L332_03675 [Agrococcus pavilionensis RW1]